MNKKGRCISTILGIKVDCINLTEVLKKLVRWVEGSGQRYIVTPNPEMLVEAQKDEQFKRVLNEADLAIPDGIGLVWSSRAIKERVAGAELMMEMCRLASQKGYKGFFLGGGGETASKDASKIEKKIDGLVIKKETGPQNIKKGNDNEKERGEKKNKEF